MWSTVQPPYEETQLAVGLLRHASLNDCRQGCNFWKLIGGAERGKDAQGTIKILLDTDFTSDLAHFLHSIRGAQLNIGDAQALLERYEVTPMTAGHQ